MKNLSKLLAVVAALCIAGPASWAGGFGKLNIFNHLGVGVNVGTVGAGFELATPITNFVTLRAGATFMPGFSFSTSFDGEYTPTVAGGQSYTQDFTMDVDASLKRTQGSVIFNIYPLPKLTSFYVAAGAYFGGSSIIGITGHSNELEQLSHNDNPFIEIGDYKLPVDENGNVNGSLRAKSFRPYLGLGFGRPLPKGRLNFGVELGVQFMGKMRIYNGDTELHPSDYLDNDDDWQKWMDKLTVYPVLKFTLSGRIF